MVWIDFLSRMDVITSYTDSRIYNAWHSEIDCSQYPQTEPFHIQCSTSKQQYPRLGLNLFRGEPAISEFDWNFTANHKSSKHFTTCPGSALHKVSPLLQPAHGQITRFRVCSIVLVALLRLAFASAPCFPLNLAQYHNSPAHSAKGTLSRINALELFVSIWFQYSISLPSRGSFHLSLTVLVHYRSLKSIQPYGMVPVDSDKISRVSSYSGYT